MIAVALLAWAAGVAHASDPALIVLPPSGGPDEATVARALARAGLRRDRTIDAAHFVKGVSHLPLVGGLGPDCTGPEDLSEWRHQLLAARRKFDMFDAEGSLSDLVGLELELECLGAPVTAEDLFTLDIARAEAHLLLASASASSDAGQAAFHAQEASAALDRAVAAGEGIQTPVSVSPELREALSAARVRSERFAATRLAFVGDDNGVEVWVNGSRVRAPVAGAVGDNLVERVEDGIVTAARRVQLREGEGAVLDLDGDDAALGDLVTGLVRHSPSHEEQARLAALAGVRAPEARVIYLGWDRGGPAAWQVVGDDLVRLVVPKAEAETAVVDLDEPEVPARPRPDPGDARHPVAPRERPEPVRNSRGKPRDEVDEWTATAAAGLGGGWSSSGEGGAVIAAALSGRVALFPSWSLAWAVSPTAPVATLDPAGDGIVASVPLKVGARYGLQRRELSPEAGIDLGVRFSPAIGSTEISGTVAACGGLSGATGPATAVRLEGCLDTDFAGAGFVAAFGVESRI